jgi:nitric oxide dioxygenase
MQPKNKIIKARPRQARRLRQGGHTPSLNPGLPRNGKFNFKQAQLLRRTFDRIMAQGSIAGLIFYQKLFAASPELRRLFHTSVDVQTRKLMESLNYVVATLEDPNALIPVLAGLGRRHVTYGAQERHYDLVIEALLATFKVALGESFTAEVHKAWREALNFVTATMKRGAQKAGEGTARSLGSPLEGRHDLPLPENCRRS